MSAMPRLFIVGCERSGTTMLAAMIDRHSRVAVPPETHLFIGLPQKLRELHARPDTEKRVEWILQSERLRDLNLTPGQVIDRLPAGDTSLAAISMAVLAAYARSVGKDFCCAKTPSHLYCTPMLLRWFPDARIVCVVRDGRDVVQSLNKTPWAKDDGNRKNATKWWIAARACDTFEARYPDRFMRVHFEALVRDPEEQLRRVDAFMGLDFETGQLDTHKETHVVPTWETQWKGKANERPDPSRVGAWKRDLTPEAVWELNAWMSPYLAKFGYADTELDGCPAFKRTKLMLTAKASHARYADAIGADLAGLPDAAAFRAMLAGTYEPAAA